MCVAKRKSLNQNHPTDDDPTYDYPDELPPLPQPRTNAIQVTTNTAYALAKLALSHTHETTMDTANPAYGLTYDYPDELPPLPQPRTDAIQVTTNTAYALARLALSHTHEITMDTANPAYGLTLSAEGIPIVPMV